MLLLRRALIVAVSTVALLVLLAADISRAHKHSHHHHHNTLHSNNDDKDSDKHLSAEKLRHEKLRFHEEMHKPVDISSAAQKTKRPAHRCMHDEPHHRAIVARHLAESSSRNAAAQQQQQQQERSQEDQQGGRAGRALVATTLERIRITISDEDLNKESQYCTKAGEVRPDFRGSTTICREDDVLTAAKRAVLVQKVLPAAVALIRGLLTLPPTADPIVVPADACSGLGFTIPASHTTSGVANTDYILYVAAPRTPNGVLAFAGGCGTGANGRVVYGRAAFGPEFLVWSDTNPAGNDDLIKTAVHEIFHALGFTYDLLKTQTVTATRRGKSVTIFTGLRSLAAGKKHFGCEAMTGLELEDEGETGSKLSHPDKRLMADDFMAASGGVLLSRLSVAMLADLGHYTPIDDSVQNMTYGLNGGCGFINERCNTDAGGNGKTFCTDESIVDACSYDYTGSGYCGVSTYSNPLATHFQYFPTNDKKGGKEFYDYCPIIEVYSNRRCNFERQATHTDYILGFTFSRTSRCFRTANVARSGFGGGDINYGNTRCLISRCQPDGRGGQFVQFQINGSAWIDCNDEGKSMGGLPGYDGTIICPSSFADFCYWYDKVPSPPDGYPQDYVGDTSATNDNPFGQVPLRSGTIDWIVGEMIFFADRWASVPVNDKDRPPASIVQELQKDAASLLGVAIREFFFKEAKLQAKSAGSTDKILRTSYTIVDQSLTPETITSRLNQVKTANSTAWLGRTRSAYQAAATNATDSPRLSEYTADYALNFLERLFLGLGVGPFSGIVVAAFIFVCIVVALAFCLCRDTCCPNKDDAVSQDSSHDVIDDNRRANKRAAQLPQTKKVVVRSQVPKGYNSAYP